MFECEGIFNNNINVGIVVLINTLFLEGFSQEVRKWNVFREKTTKKCPEDSRGG